MKINKSKVALCLLAVSAATSSVMAHADSFSTADTDATDLTFSVPATPTSLTLTPSSSLPVGDELALNNTKIVRIVNSLHTGTARLAIGYTPGVVNQDGFSSTTMQATIHGTNNSQHLMKVDMANFPGSSKVQTINGVSMFVTPTDKTAMSGDLILKGNQTLSVDTYVLSLDGAVYNP